MSAPLHHVAAHPTLPLREGRQNSSGERSEREGFFGEGSWRRAGAARTPPRNASRFDGRPLTRPPPSRGVSDFVENGGKNSSCFVLYWDVYSQYEHKFSHVQPAPRDPRGDDARAPKTAGTAGTQGEGGGGKPRRESNYVAEEAPRRRAPRQPQRRDAWPDDAAQTRASRRHRASRPQTAPALHGGRDAAQNRAIAEREYGASDRGRAEAIRMGSCVPIHRGGVR